MAKKTTNDEEDVAAFFATLDHPLKVELAAVRDTVRHAHPDLKERIKWAAPSYHYLGQDLVTFNHRNGKKVQLVFHHPTIANIESGLLTGEYKDRRLAEFTSMADVEAKQPELSRVMKAYIAGIQA